MSLGLLEIPKSELMLMEVQEVFYVLKAYEKRTTNEEVKLRLLCFYLVAPHWNDKKYGVLRTPTQLWPIDGDVTKEVKMSKITRLKPGEKPFTKLYGKSV